MAYRFGVVGTGFGILLLLGLSVSALAENTANLQPVPRADEIDEAHKTIVDAFGIRLISKDPERVERVFGELLKSGMPESRNTTAQQYASLQAAIDLAVRNENLVFMQRAVDQMATRFDVNATAIKYEGTK